MEKLWTGRFSKNLNEIADEFNKSIKFDCKLVYDDILGSIEHTKMLKEMKIIPEKDAEILVQELKNIYSDLENGITKIDYSCEDVHMFIEQELVKRVGDIGKRVHTARSRNDQVALDIRLYSKREIKNVIKLLKDLIETLVKVASDNLDVIMPGYTHLQRAQPILFSHQILAYVSMFLRDVDRLNDTYKRMNVCPLGSCALAGTTYNTNREMVAKNLDFDMPSINSIDGVSDRDFAVEILSDLSLISMHLSRFSEEIILWTSWEFKFIELDDSFTTGSSIMPQKKNSDMAELVRGKTGRIYGNLVTMLTILKSLPLAYNKDLQEDKEPLFDSFETVKNCLMVFAPMIESMKIKKENMLNASKEGFINATDLADYLTKKGMPFRTAYKIVGEIVAYSIQNGKTLEELDINEYKNFSDMFENDLYKAIDLVNCVNTRTSFGGTSVDSVKKQIDYFNNEIKKIN